MKNNNKVESTHILYIRKTFSCTWFSCAPRIQNVAEAGPTPEIHPVQMQMRTMRRIILSLYTIHSTISTNNKLFLPSKQIIYKPC